jgi:glycosyltransferase involved in cell wall biosynthesis
VGPLDPASSGGTLTARFRGRHGRAPRVLHIGNIANNAFYNAKILNQHGYDCDVMCADYYHIMGCPEWEEADFIGHIGDQFRPDWSAVDLQGYQRPRWFAQGPQQMCIDYLIARRTGDTDLATQRWDALGRANNTSTDGDALTVLSRLRAQWRYHRANAARYVIMVRERPDALRLIADKLKTFAYTRGLGGQAIRAAALPVLLTGAAVLRAFSAATLPRQLAFWRSRFAGEFPDRRDQMVDEDLLLNLIEQPRWQPLFALYDVIVAYSTDGIAPLLAGVPYFCLEHGTLREIPYRDTDQGRRTALAYRMAEHVFVTNFDCLDSARRLAPGKFTLINHPFDEDQGLAVEGWQAERERLQAELDCEWLFFFPTRQDWVPGTGYADKANDVFIRAFAELRRRHRVGMVCCEWGANVAQSRELIDTLGCGRHVTWISPLPTVQFERLCRAAHCVVDQFKLGSFGGVMFKAMAVGAPMLTYLDEEQLRRQFPDIPPVVNCRTSSEISSAMDRLLQHPEELARYGDAARAWMRRNHGKAETIRLQEEQFRRMLFPEPPLTASASLS